MADCPRTCGPLGLMAALAVALATMLAFGPGIGAASESAEAAEAPEQGERSDGSERIGRTELDPPRGIVVRLEDEEGESPRRLRGLMVAYDERGFELRDRERRPHRIAWTDLEPQRVYAIHRELLSRRDGEAWLRLGIQLRRMEGGERFSNQALRHAERADDSLAERVERIREHGLEAPPTPGNADRATDRAFEPHQPRPDDGRAPDMGLDFGGPRGAAGLEEQPAQREERGQARGRHQQWLEIDEQQRGRVIAHLEAFAEAGLDQIDVSMRRHETRYFLLYTDLPEAEARRWAQLADRMYLRLAELFGVAEGANIWHGKCVLFIFADEADYHSFEAEVHGQPGEDTAGRCWTFATGEVHITLYRQVDRYRSAQVLVHEATHGFLHRYRSPVNVPSWLNEGLADTIASELVPEDDAVEHRQRLARQVLRRRRALGDFFDAEHIEAWHYGVASSMTQFMIRRDRAAYVATIDAIKDGTPWRQALTEHFGLTPEQLVRTWSASENLGRIEP